MPSSQLIQRLSAETSRVAKQVFVLMNRDRADRSETSVGHAVEIYMVWKGLLGCAEQRDHKKEYLPPDQVAKAVGCLPASYPDIRREIQLIYDICLPRAEVV
jgi:hypothetical protein